MCISFRHPPRPEDFKGRTSEKEEKSAPSSSGENAPSFFISFSEHASEEVIQYIVKQLEGQDLQCELLSDGTCPSVTITGKLKVLSKQVLVFIMVVVIF